MSFLERLPLRRALRRRALAAMRVALGPYALLGTSAGLGLLLISIAAQALFDPFAAAAVAVGVIAAVPPDQPAPRRGKLRQLAPSVVVGLPLFYGVQLLHDDALRLGLLIVPASFVAFLGAAWGKRGIPLSVSAMLAIVFSMAVPGREAGVSPLSTSLHFALGMVAYIVYATLANLALNARYRTAMLADTLYIVARLMRTQSRQFALVDPSNVKPPEPIGRWMQEQAILADQLQAARDILLESPRTPRRQRLAGMLLRVVDLRDHLLACELDVDALVAHPEQAAVLAALRSRLYELAREVDHLADCLSTGRTPVVFTSHRPVLAKLPWSPDGMAETASSTLARGVADRVGHIDDETLRLIALARGDVAPDLAVVRATWRMFVSATTWSARPLIALWRPDAPPLRHALRAAMAIAAGYAISFALPWTTHPYWVLLTITVVLRGSFAQTLERRNSRVLGTLLGSLVAAALMPLDRSSATLLVIVAVAQGVAHAAAVRRYLVTAVAATVLALVQAHALDAGTSPVIEAFERIVDTLVGVGIAWAFSYVLPSWERSQIPALVRRTLEAHARHARLALALGRLEAADTKPELEWRLARREAYDSLSALVQATQRSLSEPRAVRPPLEGLGPLLAHSYQLLAQLTAAKTMLLLRRDRLDEGCLQQPLRDASASIDAALTTTVAPSTTSTQGTTSVEPLSLPDPFQHDLSAWFLRRLRLASALALEVGSDARRVLSPHADSRSHPEGVLR